MKIKANMLVSTEYELYVGQGTETDQRELMERASKENPMQYIHGIGMMLLKFEEELSGLAVGDSYEFTIPVEEAYGPQEDDYIFDLDRSIFEVNGKLDEEMVFPGNVVPLMDAEGNRLNAQVLEVTGTHVKVDLNHPLAGEDLHFKGSILEVREATSEEIEKFLGPGTGCSGCDCGGEHHEEKHGGCGSDCGCD